MGTGTPGWHHHGVETTAAGHHDQQLFRSREGMTLGFIRSAKATCKPLQLGLTQNAVAVNFLGNVLPTEACFGK